MRPLPHIHLVIVVLCAIVLAGCHDIGSVDPRPYLLLTDGAIKEYHAVMVGIDHPPVPAPGKIMMALTTDLPDKNDHWRAREIADCTPGEWILDGNGYSWNLSRVVSAMAHDVPRDRLRWIIANRPVVVGISDERVTPDDLEVYVPEIDHRSPVTHKWLSKLTLGFSRKLVQPTDMDQRVGRLLVLDRWPDRRMSAEQILAARREIPLDPPLTIGQIIERKPWMAGTTTAPARAAGSVGQ